MAQKSKNALKDSSVRNNAFRKFMAMQTIDIQNVFRVFTCRLCYELC